MSVLLGSFHEAFILKTRVSSDRKLLSPQSYEHVQTALRLFFGKVELGDITQRWWQLKNGSVTSLIQMNGFFISPPTF